ncbi:hypothetical protein C8Q70DRAFT_23410 [Cubamyces menziesii]|uniref:Uncharacterized protein n=1 Tax=Trametes cubensis TaxID=1111947 RepID=A0AAD7TS45_9APHY|nr:hypothetical protein C8Q70DRAFT_23410 [Cubamyces menziesii]KAJ8475405.1 hypothetical protein ONZ51_g6583 [Trametes cubensis]
MNQPTAHELDPVAGGSNETLWTPEACLQGYQAANDQYWREHGLTMTHSSFTLANGSSSSNVALAAVPGTYRARRDGTPYEILPQRQYIAKRRFDPRPPITFRTASEPYIRLADALAGNVRNLQGRDEPVFSQEHLLHQQPLHVEIPGLDEQSASQDHLTQKQSLRLELVNCRSYERQINVRNPAHSSHSITKGRLAEKIAREIFDYFNRHQADPLGSPLLGPGARGFEKIILLELRHVSKSSWQPVLGVLRST